MKIIEKGNNEIVILLKDCKDRWVEVVSLRYTSGLNLPWEWNSKGATLLTVKTTHKDQLYSDCFYFSTVTGKLIYREINNIYDAELLTEYDFLIADNQQLNIFISDLLQDHFLTRPQYRNIASNLDVSSLKYLNEYNFMPVQMQIFLA